MLIYYKLLLVIYQYYVIDVYNDYNVYGDYMAIKTQREKKREIRLQTAIQAVNKYSQYDGYVQPDGYVQSDGYVCLSSSPITIRLTPEDIIHLEELNENFFEGELNTSVMCRVLIRKGIQWYKNLKQ